MRLLRRSTYALPQRLEIRLGVFVGTMVAFAFFVACSLAAPSVGWSAETVAPTYFVPGQASSFEVTASDAAPAGDIIIKEQLPAGVQVRSIVLKWSGIGLPLNLNAGEGFCPKPTGREVTCELPVSLFGLSIEPGQIVQAVINVEVPASISEGAVATEAVVEGGGIASASASSRIVVNAHPSFGITKLEFEPTEATHETALPPSDGEHAFEIVNEPYKQPYTQAGGHPWGLTTTFEFATEAKEANNEGEISLLPTHEAKDIVASLPPGVLGDPMAVPRCSLTIVTNNGQCPGDTQIGVYRLQLYGVKELLGPIVNVTPEVGQSAEFALEAKTIVTPLLTAHLVRTPEGYGFDVADNGVPQVDLRRSELTFWGTPADPSHNAMRGRFCGKSHINEALTCSIAGGEQSHLPPVPFLSMPTGCSSGPESDELRADSWQEPGSVAINGQYNDYAESATVFPAVTDCNLLQFNAGTGVTVEPDTQTADEPVGLGVGLKIPLNEGAGTNTTPALRDTLITLPEGMSVSPGVVDGIEACNATGPEGINITGPESEEVGLSGELQLAPGHCPDDSTVGTAEAISPFLPTPVKGHLYLARPGCGGPHQSACTEEDVRDGKLYKLYLELGGTGQFANTGIQFKVPLETEVNPATGQLTAVDRELVQTPYSEVKIHLNGGPRAPLANPAVCGPAVTTADLTPWSAPGVTPEGLLEAGTPDVMSSSYFEVKGCSNPMPFKPGFTAGTVTPQAGQYSAFTMNLSRGDGEQYVKGIQIHTPPGLLGMLSNVTQLCGEAEADSGYCPEASKIGTTRVATGAGSHPFEIEGNVYLTGPYGGSPYGLSIVVNVVAGPFNLGLKVVRARIAVDPVTSDLTITTDESGPYAVPQIVFGVPVRLKRITVDIDRPNFMFNPTNCNEQQIEAKLSGAEDAVWSAKSKFAVGGCTSLAFKPAFTATTSGQTSRAKGASLDVKLSYPQGSVGSDANVAEAKVDLPKQLPSRLTTLQKACTAAIFAANPANCPAASIVGVAKSKTPLLPVELTGPVYFVSHGGEAFPSLIVVLQGEGVRVDLTGTTFISKAGITSSTFSTVPDVPVETFELYLPEGKYSALAANGNLCKSRAKLKMPTKFVAQNGAVIKQSTQIQVTGCTTTAKATRSKSKPSEHKGRAGK